MMANDLEKKRAILKFCEGLFATRNLIGTDYDDVNMMQVKGRDFVQQPGGDGLHVTFSVSSHAIGKAHGISREVFAVLGLTDEEDGTASPAPGG